MRVYIHPFHTLPFHTMQTTLSDLLTNTHSYTEIYTNESIYQVDSEQIVQLNPIDGEKIIYKEFIQGITLVVDHSYFQKTVETSIHGNEHVHHTMKKYVYRLHPKSKLKLIIETKEGKALNMNDVLITDVYFEFDEIVDIKELFVKREIIEFLSLLN